MLWAVWVLLTLAKPHSMLHPNTRQSCNRHNELFQHQLLWQKTQHVTLIGAVKDAMIRLGNQLATSLGKHVTQTHTAVVRGDLVTNGLFSHHSPCIYAERWPGHKRTVQPPLSLHIHRGVTWSGDWEVTWSQANCSATTHLAETLRGDLVTNAFLRSQGVTVTHLAVGERVVPRQTRVALTASNVWQAAAKRSTHSDISDSSEWHPRYMCVTLTVTYLTGE